MNGASLGGMSMPADAERRHILERMAAFRLAMPPDAIANDPPFGDTPRAVFQPRSRG